MWVRFSDMICCPICMGNLKLSVFKGSKESITETHVDLAQRNGIDIEKLSQYVEEGLLLCNKCLLCYPITHGVPVLLTYETPLHKQFSTRYPLEMERLASDYSFAAQVPPPGEEQVLQSFSKEWGDYEYDGVIWELNYADHEKRILMEIGETWKPRSEKQIGRFLEVGCGIGITEFLVHQNLQVDAVGVDLSLAAMQASEHYRSNPFLHFVQASAFHLPFPKQSFDIVYSRGVLHHTYSTEAAFRHAASMCGKYGLLYIWVYGRGSILASPLRITAYAAETLLRPILSRHPDDILAKCFLRLIAIPYMLYNRIRRSMDSTIERLTFGRAIHAARDRFTPKYAHRHKPLELIRWFEEEGFKTVEQVDWRTMPTADQGDYSRNVGVRGTRMMTHPSR